MNSKTLAKFYDRLTPQERLPLIAAAMERGDDADADRLSRSASRLHLSLPDYHGLSEGLMLLTFFHVIDQLDRGLSYWRLVSAAADTKAGPFDADDKEQADRLWRLARLTAYRVSVEAEGWAQFCAEQHLDGEALLRDLPCYATLQHLQQVAQAFAFSAEEAVEELRRSGRGHAELYTPEGVAQEQRKFLDARVAWWNGDG